MPSDSTISFIVDSNILIYASDPADPPKRDRARMVLTRLDRLRRGVLTAQILGEFFSVATRQLRRPVDEDLAATQAIQFALRWPVLDTNRVVVLEAYEARLRHGLHYYDAQIWASARLAGIPYVLSQDFEDGRVVEGVTFRDPFAPGFDLDELLAG